MPFVTEPFQAYLASTLNSTDVHLPLAEAAKVDLLKLLDDEDNYTFLSIKDDVNFETVKVYARNGYLMLDRGIAGTKPVKFSFSACVSTLSPTVMAVLDAMLTDDNTCGYNPDAMGGTLTVAFTDLPEASIGKVWRGMVVFGGTIPMDISVTGLPSWVTAQTYANMLELTGAPVASATTAFTVRVTNAQNDSAINQQFSIVVR